MFDWLNANTQATPKVLQAQCHLSWNNLRQVGTVHIYFVCFGSSRFVYKGRRTRWCCPSQCPSTDRHCIFDNRLWMICLLRSNMCRVHIQCILFDLYHPDNGLRDKQSIYRWNCRIFLNRIPCKTFWHWRTILLRDIQCILFDLYCPGNGLRDKQNKHLAAAKFAIITHLTFCGTTLNRSCFTQLTFFTIGRISFFAYCIDWTYLTRRQAQLVLVLST